jgi:hypothetical protein
MDTTDEEDENGDGASSCHHHKTKEMPEKHFFTLFRMDYRTFQHVLERTKHGMQRDYLQSERAGGFVSPEAQLAFTIRWLAGVASD